MLSFQRNLHYKYIHGNLVLLCCYRCVNDFFVIFNKMVKPDWWVCFTNTLDEYRRQSEQQKHTFVRSIGNWWKRSWEYCADHALLPREINEYHPEDRLSVSWVISILLKLGLWKKHAHKLVQKEKKLFKFFGKLGQNLISTGTDQVEVS